MFNDAQLADYCDRHQLSQVARSTIAHIRSTEPTRRVQSGSHNVACRFASRKMGMVIQAESHTNELPAVVGWEHDKNTFEFYDQPPKIKLSYLRPNGRPGGHLATPDFFLLQEGFAGWIECKTEEWLQSQAAKGPALYVQDEENTWRCPSAEKYAASVGLGFQVRSSAANDWITVRNLIFLSDYLDERCPVPDSEAILRVRTAMTCQHWITLKELLDALQPADVDVLYKRIADQLLYVRLDKDLLSEPERTMVFRDQNTVEAYQVYLASQAEPALPAIQTVSLVPGQSLRWDGHLWRIANVGDESIFMEDAERVTTSLRRQVFTQMVKDGVITGLPQGTTLHQDHGDLIVRQASPRDLEGAMVRYRCLFPEQFDTPAPQSCSRARRKWQVLYRRGQELFGSGLLGLIPRISRRGNRDRRIDDAVLAIMDQVIDELFAKPGERSVTACWGTVKNQCKAAGLLEPSETAFRRQIRRRRAQDLREAREGKKAAYASAEFYWHLDQASPRHGERPFEIGHIDHTELDLQFRGGRKGEKLGKAWLTVLLDANSRMVLAWVLSFDPPSYRSCMAVIKECIRRHGRIPKTIVVDKGSDFQSVYFETLLARLESHKKTRPGSKPRFGSVIERLFGMNNEAFVHNLQGNNKALQKPRSMSKSHDPRELAVWTLPEFTTAFEGFLETYHAMEHSALGLSPKEAMSVGLAQSGMRQHVLIPFTRDLAIMCLPSTAKGTAKVHPGRGIKIDAIHYWTLAFKDPQYAGKNVPVRYDPFDKSVAFAWLKDHWAPCQSEYTNVFRGRSEKEIAIASQELRAINKRTGERRAINAALIADYLTRTDATEKRLAQRLRDQETERDALQIDPAELEMAPDKPEADPQPATVTTPPDRAEIDALEASIWGALDNQLFGD